MNEEYFCGLTGRIVTPWSPQYPEARQGWNRAIQQYPAIIVYCRTIQDVSNAVLWSKKQDLPLRIRSGGHNYEGYSNGDGTLIIDVSELNNIEIDEQRGLLRVQGGVTNRQLYAFLAAKGYPFPGGTCPTVGVSGYALGGGWGLSCRYFGLGCDSVEEVELVDYRGKLIVANRETHSDLFWACRGAGGGNFGVVVSILFRLPPKVACVTLIELDYLHAGKQRQQEFLQVWQAWLRKADHRMTLIGRIYHSPQDGLAMLARGFFYGTPEQAGEQLQGFLDLNPTQCSLQYLPFAQAVQIVGSSYPDWELFAAASRFVVCPLTTSEIARLVRMIQKRPTGSVYTGLSLYALGGKVAQVGREETAFYYRDAQFILWLETVWEDSRYATINRAWVAQHFPSFAAATTGAYVNFPYRDLPEYLDAYYGGHVALLKRIKCKYDPCNVFSFPQGILGGGSCPKPQWFLHARDHGAVFASVPNTAGPGNHRGFRYAKSG